MSRQEIGSYLGLKLETVSRAFSHFQNDRLINVKVRTIEIINLAGLKACLNNSRSAALAQRTCLTADLLERIIRHLFLLLESIQDGTSSH